jgi:hypothetical protein
MRGIKKTNCKHVEKSLKSCQDWLKENRYCNGCPNMTPNKISNELSKELICDDFWVSGSWKQPPVKIKHGDLVDIKHEEYLGTMLGRYIGKGYGVVELYNYSDGLKYIVGKVVSRGLDNNPRLISNEKLLEFIKE